MSKLTPKHIVDRNDLMIRVAEAEGANVIIMDEFHDEEGNTVRRIESSAAGETFFLEPLPAWEEAANAWQARENEQYSRRHKGSSRLYRRRTATTAYAFYEQELPVMITEPHHYRGIKEPALEFAKSGFALFALDWQEDGCSYAVSHPLDDPGLPVHAMAIIDGRMCILKDPELVPRLLFLEDLYLTGAVLSDEEAARRAWAKAGLTPPDSEMGWMMMPISVFVDVDKNEDFPNGWSK